MLSTQERDAESVLVKTLLRKNNLHASVWGKRILNACKEGEFTQEDIINAGSWVTCACGETSAYIPRVSRGLKPTDIELRRLGTEFLIHVKQNEMAKATLVLVAIEERAVEIERKYRLIRAS